MSIEKRKVALVTGANKGIGKETVRQLAQAGMTVYAGARSKERGQQTVSELKQQGLDVRFLQLDVTDDNSVQNVAKQIENESGYLDVLVNNAGTITEDERPSQKRASTGVRPSDITADSVRQTYEVNVFGVVRVTKAMLSLLQKAPAARIVNLSSPLGSLTLKADKEHLVSKVGLLAYGSSKAALNSITLYYANELRDTGILVNAANPGFVATDLNTHTGFRSVEDGAAIVLELATLDKDGPTGIFKGDDGMVPW